MDSFAGKLLLRFSRNAQVRLSNNEGHMSKNGSWKLFKNSWISTKAVLPGVWQRKEGGHVVRARVIECTTGRQKEIWKVLPELNAPAALRWLEDEKVRVESGGASAEAPKKRFAEFAQLLFERKVKTREIRSAKGRQKWANTLTHLIAGTEVVVRDGDGTETGRVVVPGFGEFFLDKLLAVHVEDWKGSLAELIAKGHYAPATCNGWLSILRVILQAAKRELGLSHLATEGVKDFDESEHDTYSEEEPNALLPEEVPLFLGAMQELFPQHYAMVFLGMVTGLRPSSLRPVRRKGPMPDVLWDSSKLLVRRSHTLGDEVMNTTKQRVKYSIHLPADAISVLRWHVDTQLETPEQQESDLLFPSVTGGFRAPSVLNKPFAEVAAAIGLKKRFTQRGLRRTFNDLARAARVEGVVTKSISGHLTERMRERYSTVAPIEQRESLAKVIDFTRAKEAAPASQSCDPRTSGEQSGEHASESGEHNEKTG
jgi:integrase